MYLLSRTGYPKEKSIWEPRKNISTKILESWKEKKKQQEKNIEKPFDIVRFEARLERLAAEKEDCHRRRKAKRRRLERQVSESESESQEEADDSNSSIEALEDKSLLETKSKAPVKEKPFEALVIPRGQRICPHCGRPCPSKSRLTQHLLTHSNAQRFTCPDCG
ncbi:uncharacterized protein K444DRAFT_399726 [Hyaloscypha bicolor E]|uniref:C2H2-type domain-containing protein n=1 Tax=Hyaloscypha bicolor E TaxID=1095630 RepID=A0A2J6TB54_9HELO|nr:uncharacterized protein K444DRAFT_399726 [Hyaloscypha bicolor E]PMD60251.1 hypothetical protein K444DRAFT_399726 [Hyaloscypha bicolor E]